MKKLLIISMFCSILFTGCINEDSNSDQIRGLLFEPSYGIEAPEMLSAFQAGSDVVLKWSKISNASFYHLYLAVNMPDNFSKVGTTFSANEANIKNLEIGRTYHFFVTAINEFGIESSPSNIISITVE